MGALLSAEATDTRAATRTRPLRDPRAPALPASVVLAAIISCFAAGVAQAACPDTSATAGRVRVQFPGPCDPARPFLAPLVDVGIALQTLPGSGATGPGVPYLLAPGECVWLERRWLPCLRSRCVGATSDVEPGDLTRPRGMGATPGATCAREWGAP